MTKTRFFAAVVSLLAAPALALAQPALNQHPASPEAVRGAVADLEKQNGDDRSAIDRADANRRSFMAAYDWETKAKEVLVAAVAARTAAIEALKAQLPPPAPTPK